MSVEQTPEDNAAETEAVLSLQETKTSENSDDVAAHCGSSSYSIAVCTGTGPVTPTKTQV
ncbi:hypothetical protein [Kitasatospora sp. CB01950]|uniref:hypothetical protein n=1 Tax=Kitasatospora sp. CB01950 TaxID=1703930 RepID=UPI00093CE794|nr:hypothetical protein [Kitasatospora sp. CB01950]OKJ02941.1 hypothetical protein AMK19_27860 [Kitasatospora sp. CB01950]